jgi:ribosomal protein S12
LQEHYVVMVRRSRVRDLPSWNTIVFK